MGIGRPTFVLPVEMYSYTVVAMRVSFSYKNTGPAFQTRSTNHNGAAHNSVRMLVLTAK
jgi:hypothetical protein